MPWKPERGDQVVAERNGVVTAWRRAEGVLFADHPRALLTNTIVAETLPDELREDRP